MTRRITVLRVNEKALIRRHNTMEETEGQLRKVGVYTGYFYLSAIDF